MRWEDRDESSNVEDRRGMGMGGVALGGTGGLIVMLLAYFLGINPSRIQVPDGGARPPEARETRRTDPAEERLAAFSKVVFHDTEVVWSDLFRKVGRAYRYPTLVLFSGMVHSACGNAQAAVGPFYCPRDEKVYIDLSFYRDMERKLEAPGDFARAYVLAHEVGHHVQHLLGFDRALRARSDSTVPIELQADYLAGVWAHHGQEKFHFLEPGDVEEALNAAFQIGDDRLQKKARGYVVPDSFTHGTSRQRVQAFTAGFESGDLRGARDLFLGE